MPSGSSDELQEDLENHTVSKEDEEFRRCLAVLSTRRRPGTLVGRRLDNERQRLVYERLVLYRIRASKLAEGVCRDELDDMTLRKEYSPEALEEMYYNDPLSYHDQVDTCDWYFDRDYAVHSYLTDYQRLVLANGDDGMMFLDWEKYRSWFTSYEIDTEYIKYFEEISTKIKWIKEYMECERESHEWMDMEGRGFQQAVKIAVDFPCISFDLAFTAYTDHLWSVRFDYVYCEDIDHLLFEIWNRVTAQKITFRDALRQVNQENLSPRHKGRMQFALDNCIYSNLQFSFDICVEGIPDDAPEDEARRLIAWAVWNKLPKRKTWNQYLMRKIEVAKHIGLDLQRRPHNPYGFFLAVLLEDGPVAVLPALGFLAPLVLAAGQGGVELGSPVHPPLHLLYRPLRLLRCCLHRLPPRVAQHRCRRGRPRATLFCTSADDSSSRRSRSLVADLQCVVRTC
ncbi:uncharacterized protein LOC124655930 [Lolium rigidum]|uniref:uncharacterized protein LOC124655930 n=1 Tax=Lolium rigidum TaxID=89674 RepID=UPI001F5C36A7|nr:uncharacterized protein LOC124655930 [Lolium rigidum]